MSLFAAIAEFFGFSRKVVEKHSEQQKRADSIAREQSIADAVDRMEDKRNAYEQAIDDAGGGAPRDDHGVPAPDLGKPG